MKCPKCGRTLYQVWAMPRGFRLGATKFDLEWCPFDQQFFKAGKIQRVDITDA